MEHVIVPELARFEQDWRFSHAVVTNGLAFLSGVTGTRADGTVDADPTTQFEQAFKHLDQYLAAAGAALDSLVELTTYHVDLRHHLDAFVAVKDRHVTAPFPAWSCIGVSELITADALVEIRAVAAVTGSPTVDSALTQDVDPSPERTPGGDGTVGSS